MIGYLFFGLAFVFRATRTESVRFERRQTNWTIGQTVQTNSGAVIGHPAPSATDVSEYLGIPFAQPPLGPLRFAAPLPYTNNGLINASSFVGFASVCDAIEPSPILSGFRAQLV